MSVDDPDGLGIAQQRLIQLSRQLLKGFFRGLPSQIDTGETRRR